MRKRLVGRMSTSDTETDGVNQTTFTSILHNFVEFLQSIFDPIQAELACVTWMEKDVHRKLPLVWRDFLDTPITEEELKATLSKAACNKAAGRDSMCLDFLKLTVPTSRMICRPYTTGYTWMVRSWNNRSGASYCVYIRPNFQTHQRTMNQLLCWTQIINSNPYLNESISIYTL